MKIIELLKKQTEDAYQWTNKLIESVPGEKWDQTPETLETNVTWQVDHLIMSLYFQSIMVIKGHQKDIIQQVPLHEYNTLFTKANPINSIGKTIPVELLEKRKMVQKKSADIIESLTEDDLNTKLEPTETPHPTCQKQIRSVRLEYQTRNVALRTVGYAEACSGSTI